MSNLFYGINPENICVMTSPKQAPKTDKEFCRRIYQLGKEELKIRFPVSLLYPKYESGEVNVSTQSSDIKGKQVNNKREKVGSLFLTLAHFFGVYHFLYKLELSEKLRKWIKEFDPDFIYSQLSTRELIHFVGVVANEFKKPLVIHIMDDWPATINKTGIFKRIWDKKIDKEYKSLLKISDERLCISEAMSEEYNKRYGGNWKYFHNPIMHERWIPYQKKTYKAGPIFRILYSGRIGNANINSILALCDLINELRKNGLQIELFIYSPEIHLDKFIKYSNNPGIHLSEPFEHNEMPELFSQFDLLYLPVDFDKFSVKFIKLSIPTKMSAYMISGVPILIHAPGETAIVKFAKRYEAAIISEYDDIASFRETLLELIENEEIRKKAAFNAVKTARDKFDAINVRKDFQSIFLMK